MMDETLLTISQARQRYPSRPSLATMHRWMSRGARGVVLESVLVGGRRYTSKEALRRFHEALNASRTKPKACVSKTKERQIERSKSVLDALGVK